jgi:putative ubiquitin-RnfH superfamily antitoxin RatB of RatAB toxin-antitoxin module
MSTTEDIAQMSVTVVFSPAPREVFEFSLNLEVGATVATALSQAQSQGFSASNAVHVGVWGKKASAEQLLEDGDRLEIYRALTVDPKVARRLRFAGQGAKRAGLFATRRAGAKAGY